MYDQILVPTDGSEGIDHVAEVVDSAPVGQTIRQGTSHRHNLAFADEIDEGGEAMGPVSMAKVFTANVVRDVVDRAVQVCGGNGFGKDLPLADFYENVRSFRIVDGADKVHKRVVAREAFEGVDEGAIEGITRFER